IQAACHLGSQMAMSNGGGSMDPIQHVLHRMGGEAKCYGQNAHQGAVPITVLAIVAGNLRPDAICDSRQGLRSGYSHVEHLSPPRPELLLVPLHKALSHVGGVEITTQEAVGCAEQQ